MQTATPGGSDATGIGLTIGGADSASTPGPSNPTSRDEGWAEFDEKDSDREETKSETR